jgi:hypothetical protein
LCICYQIFHLLYMFTVFIYTILYEILFTHLHVLLYARLCNKLWWKKCIFLHRIRGRHGHDRMAGVLDTTLCDKVCQWLEAGRWFSPGIPVSSTINWPETEILFKVALNTPPFTECKTNSDWPPVPRKK